jgi:hypothetical protein
MHTTFLLISTYIMRNGYSHPPAFSTFVEPSSQVILEEMDALLRERANSAKAEVGPMGSHPGGAFLPSGRDGYDIHSLP